MTSANDPEDARNQIDNALAVLRSTPSNDVRAVRQTFELLAAALECARAALDELDAQLEVATGPQRDSIRDVVELQRKLQEVTLQKAELEQRLALAQADRDAEKAVHAEDNKRLHDLEKKAKGFEDLLLQDDDAFAKYFDAAIEQDEQKRGRKPPQR